MEEGNFIKHVVCCMKKKKNKVGENKKRVVITHKTFKIHASIQIDLTYKRGKLNTS